jgi:hypothetical protein
VQDSHDDVGDGPEGTPGLEAPGDDASEAEWVGFHFQVWEWELDPFSMF